MNFSVKATKQLKYRVKLVHQTPKNTAIFYTHKNWYKSCTVQGLEIPKLAASFLLPLPATKKTLYFTDKAPSLSKPT